ncbi:ABC transporter permease [Halobium salinum]|uniref:ABC transporter permease n=1 Tax=Halobium salinum TaxID=1364940 RepID=A0ABD5PI90_9EURY|nr:ABC transporter permease [Halobium salinum]
MAAAGALFDQVLNGLTIGMVYVLLAAGLSIVFGVMDVINFAHGEFFALGAYFALSVAIATGPGGFWVALLVAPLLVAVVGAGVERFTVRPLYGRNPLYHILLTFGLVLVIKDVVELVWGPQPYQFAKPPVLRGTVEILGYGYSVYSYFVVGVGLLIAVGTWLALTRTKYGLIIRAGSMDRGMVRNLGIDVDRYYTLVFAFGALLAAVGGVVIAGRQSVSPGMGDSVIIPAFIIVVLGGLGSFRGAVVGGLAVGVVQTLVRSYVPVLEGLVVFLLMIVVLLVRPQGLFGNPEWAGADEGGDLLTVSGGGVFDSTLRRRAGAALVAAFAVVPLLVGLPSYYVNTLAVSIFVWALFALSLDLVMGYAGLVSLGHVLFYGVGAYATVLVVVNLVPSLWVALAVAIAVCTAVAWVVGHLSIRVSGVYFSMITLAFAELFHSAVYKFGWTGGSDGIFGGFDPTYGLVGGPAVRSIELVGDVELFYYVALAAAVGGYLLARRLIRAPFGSVLQAIRESEDRTAFVGYDVTAYKRRAFVVSGGLAGLAGGLSATLTGGVAPEFLAWILSGEVIVMTILGGMGTLYGPMLGAGVYLVVKDVLLSLTNAGSPLLVALGEFWQGALGLLFVAFVIFVPEGLVSLPETVASRIDRRSGGGETIAEDAEVSD